MTGPAPMNTAREIEHRLAVLSPETIEVLDDSASHAGHAGARAGGGHFEVTIVSPAFAGKSRLQRHRLVYEALAPLMPQRIHALALRTFAPDEI
jgi:BolA protein